MTEVLFLLTTVFVAYVIYVVVSEQKGTSDKSPTPPAKSEDKKPQARAKQTVAQTVSATEKPAERKSTTPSEPQQETAKRGLKDPKTGEVTTGYSNYRFTKRWIKEALVTEGLAAKIYKNNELNADIEEQLKNAVVKLESIEKYRA